MTKKYIITNCPACYDDIKMCGKTLKLDPYTKESTWINCKDRTDCLLKQIVEKCKEAENAYFSSGNTDMFISGRNNFASNILAMLEIQEYE